MPSSLVDLRPAGSPRLHRLCVTVTVIFEAVQKPPPRRSPWWQGDLANLGLTVQSNTHTSNDFLASLPMLPWAASACLRAGDGKGLVAAMGQPCRAQRPTSSRSDAGATSGMQSSWLL